MGQEQLVVVEPPRGTGQVTPSGPGHSWDPQQQAFLSTTAVMSQLRSDGQFGPDGPSQQTSQFVESAVSSFNNMLSQPRKPEQSHNAARDSPPGYPLV